MTTHWLALWSTSTPNSATAPVEIEALADEAEAMEQAALRVAVVDLYLRDYIEPRRIVIEADAFDKLANGKPDERAPHHGPARPAQLTDARQRHRPRGTASTTPPWTMLENRIRARSLTPKSSWSASTSPRSTSGWPGRGCGPSASPTLITSSVTAWTSSPRSAPLSSSSRTNPTPGWGAAPGPRLGPSLTPSLRARPGFRPITRPRPWWAKSSGEHRVTG